MHPDGCVVGELVDAVLASDIANGPALASHDDGVRDLPLGTVADAVQELAVGDAEVTFCCNNCKGKVEKASDEEKLTLVFGGDKNAFEAVKK